MRLSCRDGELRLLVGAPLLWGLPVDELVQQLLPVLARAPEESLRPVRWARAVAARLDRATLQGLVAGRPLRRLRSCCQRAVVELDVRTSVAAAERFDGVAAARPEAREALERTWYGLLRHYAAPAWSRGDRPARICAALADAYLGSDRVWLTGSRDAAAPGLLLDEDAVDRQVSALLASGLGGGRPGRSVEWPDYLQQVLAPRRREEAVRLLSAVDTVLGRPGPATPRRVLDALDSGAAPAVIGILSGGAAGVLEDPETALTSALVSFVECAAETAGGAQVGVSWQTGPVLVRPDGWLASGLWPACADAASGDTRPLKAELAELETALDDPVWLAGDDPAEVAPRPVAALADIWHGGRLYDLVLCEDRLTLLLVAGRGVDVRGAVEHLAGDRSRADDRLERTLLGDVESALTASPHNLTVRLSDVVDVRLRAVLGQLAWRAVITTADGRIVLRNGRNPGTVFDLRSLLSPVLGDRLQVRGVDPRFPRLASIAPTWSLVCAGLALLLVTSAGYLSGAGRVVPAVVEQRIDAVTCVVQFVDPWQPELVRTEVDCPREPVAFLDVLALPAPFRGEAMATAFAGTGLAVALALLLVPAAVGSGLRIRATRRSERNR